ncbi:MULTISPECIES: ArsR/SmtB family transcription factor [Pseudomonas]|nr:MULTISPECIES: transcriptional regulator [Pseudomonas]
MTEKHTPAKNILANHPARELIRLEHVFGALGNPLRLAAVHMIAQGDEFLCCDVLPDIPKSTMTHHWRILRDSGVVWQQRIGREYRLSLRREDLDARFPGLLNAILQPLAHDPVTTDTINHYLLNKKP